MKIDSILENISMKSDTIKIILYVSDMVEGTYISREKKMNRLVPTK